jgi:hypothetical protein
MNIGTGKGGIEVLIGYRSSKLVVTYIQRAASERIAEIIRMACTWMGQAKEYHCDY